jgi:fructose-1,6-bisphosphatase/inositol monophosphatase family enzyme
MADIFKTADFVFFKSLLIEAGTAAMQIQNATIEIKRKSDNTIVTQADLLVQDLLIDKISAQYPDINFIHEENYAADSCTIADDTISAVIDPIDGTAMYSMHLPEWCVSVGIFKGYTPYYGFVYSPGFNMLFYNDNSNAYLNDKVKKVDRNIPIDTETNIFYASEIHNTFIIEFPGKIRNLGSTALHACLTIDNARNRTLAFIGRSRLWDWAGAIPIVIKAGGNVRYLSGQEIQYRDVIRNEYRLPDYVLVYNSDNFEMVRNIFKKKEEV